jgi:hypothetical protein
MIVVMLSSFLKSALPQRALYSQRRRFRDLSGEAPKSVKGRLASCLAGGLVLASIALMMSATLRRHSPEAASRAEAIPGRGSTPVSAGAYASATDISATDGRAAPDMHEAALSDTMPEPIIAMLNPDCAAYAREKLMIGLTNYYLQRRLRPSATSDDAAETSSLTGVLAGPGDPASTIPESSCKA